MYAIKDKLNGYTTPIPFSSEEVAKRYMKDQVIGNPTVRNSKEDFELYKTGEFDTENGYTNNCEPKLVMKATEIGD